MPVFSLTTVLTDVRNTAIVLGRAGFAQEHAYEKASLFAGAAAMLPASDNSVAIYIPGRLEFLGKHTDYAGGRSIVAAIERGFCVVASPRDDNRFRITDAVTKENASFDISPDLSPRPGHWSNYPMTLARRVARNFAAPFHGLDMAFASDLPPAAGMSSSSALMIACFFALAHVNQLFQQPEYAGNIQTHEDLAAYLATIENGQTFGSLVGDQGVGTFGGSEDHIAILTSEAGKLRQYSYCPVRFEQSISLPGGHTFAIAASGVAAEKTGSAMEKYNRASMLASAAVQQWNEATRRHDPHLAGAMACAPDAGQRLRGILASDPDLLHRFEHFHAESSEIIPAAAEALMRGDMAALGTIIDRSQKLSETLLQNQVPETIHLAGAARQLGAVAASAFGAGFGGSVWAMIDVDSAARFLAGWQADYARAFPDRVAAASFFLTGAGPAAIRLFA